MKLKLRRHNAGENLAVFPNDGGSSFVAGRFDRQKPTITGTRCGSHCACQCVGRVSFDDINSS
jgi:hypothetical protein